MALVVLVASASAANSSDAMSGGDGVPQPAAMAIDPVRDGTVVVLSLDGRYLKASFGGTPWTGLRPRSTYLLSTCVDDRVYEAPVVKKVIDLSGCEVGRRHGHGIVQSAIPTITLTGHGFVFGPVVLPRAPHIDRTQPFPVLRPPAIAAAPLAPNAIPRVGTGPALANGLPSVSATGAMGTVVISGGNAFTFQWGNSAAVAGRAPLLPPAIAHAGPISTAIVAPRSAFNLPLVAGIPPVPGVGAPPLPPGAGSVPAPAGYTGGMPPVPAVPNVPAAIASPVIVAGIPPAPGVGAPPLPPGAGSVPAPAGYTGGMPPVPAVPNAQAAIASPGAINTSLLVPRAFGSVAAPDIVGQAASDPILGPAFWGDPVLRLPLRASNAIGSPRVLTATVAVPSIVSPLSLPPVARSNVLPSDRTVAGVTGFQPPGALPTVGHGAIWTGAATPARTRVRAFSGIQNAPPPGYGAHGSTHASSFHPGLNAHVAGSPVIFGRRR